MSNPIVLINTNSKKTQIGFNAEDIQNKGDVIRVMEKIRYALNEPFRVEGETFSISASMVTALFPDHGDSLEADTKAADKSPCEVEGKQAALNIFADGQYNLLKG